MRRLVTMALIAAFAGGAALRCASGSETNADLDQNWSEADLTAWYGATQGSRLIPLAWLEALEQPGGTLPFLSAENIAKFRYLPRHAGELPIGFAIDDGDDERLTVTRLRWKSAQGPNEKWVGFNCSACHTAQISYKGATMTVQGGPTLADFQGFMETLDRSLVQVRDQPDRFARFAVRVLGAADTPLNRDKLWAELGRLAAWQTQVARLNYTELRYGYGRLDAFGHIYNKVALSVDAASPAANPSDAPVSYPFLWNAPQQDWVQWNAIAPNRALPGIAGQPFDIGALGRNAGEVIGVFADVRPTADAGLGGYASSLRISNLVGMEQMLGRLRPPAWPSSVFGAPDAAAVATGQALFQARCEGCHATMDRSDLASPIKVRQVLFRDFPAERTDIWMACNAYLKHSQSGNLVGTPRDYLTGPPTPADALLGDMLATTVLGSLVGAKGDVVKSATASLFGLQAPPAAVTFSFPSTTLNEVPAPSLSLKEQKLLRCTTEPSRVLGYKARPLNGIWATAPYLHNGSVPTLYDLLLPPDKRPQAFWTGTREYDPVRVGFVTSATSDNDFLFRTRDVTGRLIDGNSNEGHDYGSGQLGDDDRMALIAYLKSL